MGKIWKILGKSGETMENYNSNWKIHENPEKNWETRLENMENTVRIDWKASSAKGPGPGHGSSELSWPCILLLT